MSALNRKQISFLIGLPLSLSAFLSACGKTTSHSPSAAPPASTASANTNLANPGNLPFGNNQTFNHPRANQPVGPVGPDWNASPVQDDAAAFDPRQVLGNDIGAWIEINGQSFFQPKTVEADWAPFRHGYWGYDSDRGWTWMSFDRGGEYTHHYGSWRHHETYGWIWLAPRALEYRPANVTFFDHGENIGWVPFVTGQPEFYTLGASAGFDDQYWRGESAFAQISVPGFSLNFGFTMINRNEIGCENIFAAHILLQPELIVQVVNFAHRENHFSPFPGGDNKRAYQFLVPYFHNRQIPTGRLAPVDLGHGQRYLAPAGFNREVPPSERARMGLPTGPMHPGVGPRNPPHAISNPGNSIRANPAVDTAPKAGFMPSHSALPAHAAAPFTPKPAALPVAPATPSAAPATTPVAPATHAIAPLKPVAQTSELLAHRPPAPHTVVDQPVVDPKVGAPSNNPPRHAYHPMTIPDDNHGAKALPEQDGSTIDPTMDRHGFGGRVSPAPGAAAATLPVSK